jgi:hypothetical protein
LRAEKDIRLRIDLLEGQSSLLARMATKAIQEHNDEAFRQYSEKLAINKARIEELLWVSGAKTAQNILDFRVSVNHERGDSNTVREVLEMLKIGQLKMDDLPADVQTLVRKGALELKNSSKNDGRITN